MVVIFCEFKSTGCIKLAFSTMATIIFCSVWLLITRGQYSIDILSGVLFGHYFWIMCERISWILDFEWFRQPFHLRHPCFPSKCGRCLDPINQWALIGSEQSIGYELEMKEKADINKKAADKMMQIDSKKQVDEEGDENKMIGNI